MKRVWSVLTSAGFFWFVMAIAVLIDRWGVQDEARRDVIRLTFFVCAIGASILWRLEYPEEFRRLRR